MMLALATTWPPLRVAPPRELSEALEAEVYAVEPERWLARIWDIVEALLCEDEEAGKTGAVLVLKNAGANAMAT